MGPEQFGRLVDEHSAALVLYARQWCTVPEDVVQEAFLKLVRQRTAPADPVPWIYRVVRNTAISAARSQRRRGRHEGAAAGQNRAWFLPSLDGLDARLATDALERLPPEQRETIVAHLWGGLTFEQIAKVAGTSSSTAHRTYMAGLTALRERLGITCTNRITEST
jgi:RNA polymerase sigma-70 factor (ECF subfamily)